jgi:hypothetical protein
MSISAYFEDLNKAYRAEIEDLETDSEGKNVLATRLGEKRAQFALLMPMIEFAPEMVAPAFHGGVRFTDAQALMMLSFAEPEEFPSWDELRHAVQFEAWAAKLVPIALAESGGERFLLTVIVLEFLHAKDSNRHMAGRDTGADADEATSAEEDGDGNRETDDDDVDLEEAGSDFLAEQGFDRRG